MCLQAFVKEIVAQDRDRQDEQPFVIINAEPQRLRGTRGCRSASKNRQETGFAGSLAAVAMLNF